AGGENVSWPTTILPVTINWSYYEVALPFTRNPHRLCLRAGGESGLAQALPALPHRRERVLGRHLGSFRLPDHHAAWPHPHQHGIGGLSADDHLRRREPGVQVLRRQDPDLDART